MKEFQGFRKIPRLSRDCVITEKIDGTNGVIYIGEDGEFLIGSHTRWLDEHTDNHGFYKWCIENKEELLKLGKGTHFGEWWGSGIQRGYNLPKGEKRFSLFNTGRWVKKEYVYLNSLGEFCDSPELKEKQDYCPDCCHVVPILYEGIFDTGIIEDCLDELQKTGSIAQPGFMKPEGIVIFHKAGNIMFKKTIENDYEPKSLNKEKQS